MLCGLSVLIFHFLDEEESLSTSRKAACSFILRYSVTDSFFHVYHEAIANKRHAVVPKSDKEKVREELALDQMKILRAMAINIELRAQPLQIRKRLLPYSSSFEKRSERVRIKR